MELRFDEPSFCWAKSHENTAPEQSTQPQGYAVRAVLPTLKHDSNEREFETIMLPGVMTIPVEDESEIFKRTAVFHVLLDGQEIGQHEVSMRDCIPILSDATVEWQQTTNSNNHNAGSVVVKIRTSTNREPREKIQRYMNYQKKAASLTRSLALHKNAVAVGLLPPIIGCVVGIVATSPFWLPLMLLIGFVGFPVWVIVAVAATLLIAISAVSTVVAVSLAKSKRVKKTAKEICQSSGGQFILFDNSGHGPSTGEIVERTMEYINGDPARKLLVSLVIDFIGSSTFVLPVVGELADLVWAPASAGLISAMYHKTSPKFKYLAFIEEFLPFTDFIPTATIAWMKENLSLKEITNVLGKLRP
ncbi:hypothetical protein Poli38472_005946 [Pythium oligandrum]|uniref:Uncharacterized protein n=1 Tax=Pythium oligandrum TaxID=41045 RepID=A0A8K1CT68_PYTOL|nr:hypothetical protein Poli38472_005946 [Pythium oligandrum]|eukprot:TMW68478.1 hypothetical protein Poli38472_005946 [Pythium oligandrum]